MSWLFDLFRRLTAAALALLLLACAAEVALRWQRFQRGSAAARLVDHNLPVQPSRAVGWELPLAWYGTGTHVETRAPLPLRVNSLGIRGPEISRPKPAGTLRIICLGDDTTLAPGHAEDEAYPGRLAVLLRDAVTTPVEVLNAGLPAACPLTEVIHYRRLLSPLQPDVVIVHLDLSDAFEDAAARQHLRLDDAGEPVAVVHPSLEVREGPLSAAARDFALVDWLSGRLGAQVAGSPDAAEGDVFQRQLLAWQGDPSTAALSAPDAAAAALSPTAARSPPRVLAPLASLQAALTADAATLVVATCPNAWQAAARLRQTRGDGSDNPLLDAPAVVLQAWCREQGVVVVDAAAAVLRHPQPAALYLPDGSGLSAAGHALYAAEIARALTGGTRVDRVQTDAAMSR